MKRLSINVPSYPELDYTAAVDGTSLVIDTDVPQEMMQMVKLWIRVEVMTQ